MEQNIEQLKMELESVIKTCGKFPNKPAEILGFIEQWRWIKPLLATHVQKLILRAENKVMDNVLGECIAIDPKTRKIDTYITRKCLKAYEKQLQSELKSLEKEKDEKYHRGL